MQKCEACSARVRSRFWPHLAPLYNASHLCRHPPLRLISPCTRLGAQQALKAPPSKQRCTSRHRKSLACNSLLSHLKAQHVSSIQRGTRNSLQEYLDSKATAAPAPVPSPTPPRPVTVVRACSLRFELQTYNCVCSIGLLFGHLLRSMLMPKPPLRLVKHNPRLDRPVIECFQWQERRIQACAHQ